MIIIKDNNTTTKYAENDNEFTDSIFTPGGALNLFYKIQKHKDETLFFITPKHGIARRHHDGFFCKFSKLDNGKFFFQHTLDTITQA